MLSESGSTDPIEEIRNRARNLVLDALAKGWGGPPFDAIELAKVLNFDMMPNESISDARTLALSDNKFRIEYNPFQKPTRLNFSICHEITHTLFTDCHEEIRNREETLTEETRELEQLCNIGASELQLPYVIFPVDANALVDITALDLINLAKKYKSSLESLFISFVQVVDRPCAVMVCTFQDEKTVSIDYSKSSSRMAIQIPENFVLPSDSRAYYCNIPGVTESETVRWAFMDEDYDVYYVGISSIRKDNRARLAAIIVPNRGRGKIQHRRINIEIGDATKPRGEGNKIIAQVVNTGAGLGAGFGKALSKNYPDIKDFLKTWKEKKIDFRLGNSQLVQVAPDIYVCQMLAQNGIFAKNGKIPLEYTSLQQCLVKLREFSLQYNADVYMPLIGSGQAKGNWDVIEGLIYAELINHDIRVNIYLLPGTKAEWFKPHQSLSLFNEKSTWRKEK